MARAGRRKFKPILVNKKESDKIPDEKTCEDAASQRNPDATHALAIKHCVDRVDQLIYFSQSCTFKKSIAVSMNAAFQKNNIVFCLIQSSQIYFFIGFRKIQLLSRNFLRQFLMKKLQKPRKT